MRCKVSRYAKQVEISNRLNSIHHQVSSTAILWNSIQAREWLGLEQICQTCVCLLVSLSPVVWSSLVDEAHHPPNKSGYGHNNVKEKTEIADQRTFIHSTLYHRLLLQIPKPSYQKLPTDPSTSNIVYFPPVYAATSGPSMGVSELKRRAPNQCHIII